MSHKLPGGLYALIDDGVRPELPVLEKARAVIAAGVGVLQLRLEQQAHDRVAAELVAQVVALAREKGTRVIVNDRVDWALAGGAHGVHLGAEDLPVAVARRLLGPHALIGATTRTLDDIRRAAGEGADHVGLGPIFSTTTKQVAYPPLGIELFTRIVGAAPLPVVGIAGVTLENIGLVARAGARCAAVAGDLLRAADLELRARQLATAFALESRAAE